MIIVDSFFWFNLFFSKYMQSLIILLPVIFYYLVGVVNQFSTRHLLFIHKVLVISLILLPISLTLTTLVTNNKQLVSATPPISGSGFQSAAPNAESGALFSAAENQSYLSALLTDTSNFLAALGSLISLVGAAAFAISLVLLLMNVLNQIVFMRSLYRRASSIGYYQGISIITAETIKIPVSTRFFKKRIYLPGGLSPEQLKVVLRHEQNHFYRHHHYWQLADTLLAYLYWFNPLSHIMRHTGETYREMECDDLTIKTIDKIIYGKTLVAVAERPLLSGRATFLGHACSNKYALHRRINNILGGKKHSTYRPLKLVSLILCTAALSGCLASDFFSQNQLEKEVVEKMDLVIASQKANEDYLDYDTTPSHVIDLLLLSQDRRYFSHRGVDNFAMARAVYKHLSNGNSSGGSTITMQAATNFIIGHDSAVRKESEYRYKSLQMRIARILDKHYDKKTILSVYLSGIFFGNKNYGLKQAANFYLDTNVTNLSKQQSALLIQMIPAPALLNPTNRPHNAHNRAETMLKHYQATEFITTGDR